MRRARSLLRHAALRARGVRVRLTLWYLGILLGVLAIFSVAMYLGLARNLRAELDRSLELAARQVLALSPDEQPRLVPSALPPAYAVSLHEPGGRRLDSVGRGEPLPLRPEVASAVARGRTVLRTITLDDDPWRVLARPVSVDGRVVAILQVGRSEEAVEEAVEQLGLLLTTLVPLALLLAAAGGLFLAGRALDPIDRITRTAAAIGAEDLSRRLPREVVAVPDEVGRLAATFNHMLDRLEATFQRQRQFTTDAAHELRTPVTLLLSQLDVALDQPHWPEQHRRVLRSLREDAVRLRQLLDALLTLARADAHQEVLTRERTDLAWLAEHVVEVMRPLADERGVALTAVAEPGAVVYGDEARLMQMLVNLVENALKHTRAGGSVVVTVAIESDHTALLSVRDTGVGIAPEHLPHVFERFYRVDPSRSAGGTGLGLAIARWIAEVHSGSIGVESHPGAGSTFTVRLPRSPRPVPPVPAREPSG